MGKVIVHNLMSLDGYYAGPAKQVDAIWKYLHSDYNHDSSFHHFNIELLRSSFVLLIGKETYLDKFNNNWSKMLNDPNASFLQREIANAIGSIDKIIISDTLTAEDILPGNNTQIIKRKDVFKTIIDLKHTSDKNIAIIGSRTLWQDLLTHDLVDELRLTIAPVLSCSGTLLFDHQPEVYLKRSDTRIAEGNIMVAFQVSRNKT